MGSQPSRSAARRSACARSVVLALCSTLLGAAALAAAPGAGAGAGWQTLARLDDEEWAAVPTSMTSVTGDAGGVVISVDGQMRSKTTGHSDFVRWTVTLADCRSDSGNLVTSDMTGKFVVPFAYVKGALTFEAIVAQTLCSWYFNANK